MMIRTDQVRCIKVNFNFFVLQIYHLLLLGDAIFSIQKTKLDEVTGWSLDVVTFLPQEPHMTI